MTEVRGPLLAVVLAAAAAAAAVVAVAAASYGLHQGLLALGLASGAAAALVAVAMVAALALGFALVRRPAPPSTPPAVVDSNELAVAHGPPPLALVGELVRERPLLALAATLAVGLVVARRPHLVRHALDLLARQGVSLVR